MTAHMDRFIILLGIVYWPLFISFGAYSERRSGFSDMAPKRL